MQKNRKMILGVGGAILVLCLLLTCVAGLGSYFYWDEISAILGLSQPQNAAQMLPEDTQFYLSMSPNLQNVAGYQNLKTLYLDNPDIQNLIEEFEAELSAETDLIFETDIQPWLGNEVIFALPDLSGSIADQNETPAIVIAAMTTDTAASDQFVQKVMASAAEDGDPFVDEVYQTITLHVQDSEFGDDAIFATFNDFVVASNDLALIKDMIDKSQGITERPGLADSPRFQRVLSELPPEAVMTSYWDFSGLFEAIFQDLPVELPAQQTQDLEAFEGMGLAGTLQPDGIQLDFALTYDTAKMSERMRASFDQPASPNAILNQVPSNALLSYNAKNLKAIWEQAKEGLEANPDFGETMQDLESEFGFSLDEDLFGWMTGEFALIIVEAEPPDDFSPPIGGYLLIGTDDVNQASTGVQNIMDSFEDQGMLPPLRDETIDGVQVRGFTDFFSGTFQGGYGFHNNYFFAAYLEDSIKAFAGASQDSMTTSPNFSAVQARLPQNNYGYLYLDIDRLQTMGESQLSDFEREDYETNVRPFIEPIHAAGAAANADATGEGVSKGSFFFLITE